MPIATCRAVYVEEQGSRQGASGDHTYATSSTEAAATIDGAVTITRHLRSGSVCAITVFSVL